jgi:hypothetical protein
MESKTAVEDSFIAVRLAFSIGRAMTALSAHRSALEWRSVFYRIGTPALMVLFLIAIILLFGPKGLQQVAQELTDALSNFRGGPGSPSHPIPADDSKLINRKAERSD